MKSLRSVLCILLFCTLASTGWCQYTFIHKASNILYNNSPVESISTSDGGSLIATNSEAPISSIRISILLIKFDMDGNHEWTRLIFSMEGHLQSLSLAESKNAYVIGGIIRRDVGDTHQIVIRTDLSGDVQWARKYYPNGATVANSYDINVFPNGEILFNNISLANGTSGPQHVVLGKLDTLGNILWTKHYEDTWQYGYGMLTSSGDVLLQHANVLTMTDQSGKVKWTQQIVGIAYGTKPVEINSKKILLPLNQPSSNTFSLMAINENGTILWTTELFPGYPSKVINTSDGNVLVLANNNQTVINGTLHYLFDQSGNLLKINAVTFESNIAWLSSINEVCGKNFMGFTSSGTNLVYYKINSDLKSKCSDTVLFNTLPPENYTRVPLVVTEGNRDYLYDDLFLIAMDAGFTADTICDNRSCEEINLGNDTIICGANSFTIGVPDNPKACIRKSKKRGYIWSTGESTPNITVSKSGTYWLEVIDYDCSSRDTINIIFDYSQLDLGENLKICTEKNESKELSAPGFTKYLWSNGSTSSSIKVEEPGIYWVSARSVLGCDYIDTVTIEDECPPRLYIPQIFSPNGDGINDVLQPSGYFVKDFRLQIFNRWGRLVFESKDPQSGWNGIVDGQPALEGIYVWIVDYAGAYMDSSIRESTKGTVALIR
jgi:gliding motility-associated-like protein